MGAVLTAAQQDAYYKSEGSKAAPLSPTAWLAAQTASAPSASNPVATVGPSVLGPTIQTPAPITYNVSAANTPSMLYTMPPATSMPDYKATLAALPTSAAIAAEQSPEQLAAASQNKSLQDQILASLGGIGDKTQALDASTGMSATQNELNDVYGQISGLQQEAQAIPLQVQANSEGRGITTAGAAPIEADLTRNNAIKALGLSARASVLSGKLGQAKQQMDRLMQVQQMELDYLKTALSFNQDRMSKADQAQATQIQIRLKERQDALDKQTTASNTVMNMLLQAKAAGAPDSVIAQAHALDPLGAESLLAPYLKQKADLMTVAKGATVIDPATGKVIYTAPESGTGAATFTTTQMNGGAANANMPIANFAQLDADTKNYFINTYKTSQLAKDVAAVQGGGTTSTGENKQVVAHGVATSNLPDSVKQAILAMLGVSMADASTDPNAGGGFWSGIGNVLGGSFNFARNLVGL